MGEKGQRREVSVSSTKEANSQNAHPSRSLASRSRGYGIAAGYESPYRGKTSAPSASQLDQYGPVPHSGYYGAGEGAGSFKRGQAGYSEELLWYLAQYGEKTSGFDSTD